MPFCVLAASCFPSSVACASLAIFSRFISRYNFTFAAFSCTNDVRISFLVGWELIDTEDCIFAIGTDIVAARGIGVKLGPSPGKL